MLTMRNCEQEFLQDREEMFNEYDRSNFIANANVVLAKVQDFPIYVKSETLVNTLTKTIQGLSQIEIDSYAVSEFISNIGESDRIDGAKIIMKDISIPETMVIKIQYMNEALSSYTSTIYAIKDGKISPGKAKRFCEKVDDYADTLKRRIVSNASIYNGTPKELLAMENPTTATITKEYLNNVVIPYLKAVPKQKRELMDLANTVRSSMTVVRSALTDADYMLTATCEDKETKKALMKYIYNYGRALMDVASFVVFSTIRKIHLFEENVVELQKLYNALTLLFNDAMPIVESGLFSNRVISPADSNNLMEKFLEGENDIYVELAHNIIEYHKGYLSTRYETDNEIAGMDIDGYIETVVSKYEYDKKVFDDLIKMYIDIGNGLDILAKNSDDYLMIFDELVTKSGFVTPLEHRFDVFLEGIRNLNSYSMADLEVGEHGEKTDVYFRLLAEIYAYPENTKRIAETARDIWKKFEYVRELFESDKNGELEYSETMNELKIFIESLEEQYRDLTRIATKRLLHRLKILANKADRCIDNMDGNPEEDPNEALDFNDRDDFFEEAVLSMIEEKNNMNDLMMEVLLKEYYAEREFQERGVHLVYEAPASTQPSVNTGNTANTQQSNTKVTVTDNAGSSTSSGGKINQSKLTEIINGINSWFDKMMNSFTDMINRQKVKNGNWLANNKEALLGRSYSNVQVQILPYEKGMPENTIRQNIDKMKTNIGAMNAANIQKVTSYEDMRAKLINFGPKFNNANSDEKTIITNYYKVGKLPMEVETVANGEIKALVSNTLIPYCEKFYTTFYEEIKNKMNEIKTSMENVTRTYVSESVKEMENGLLFTEAPNNTTQNNENTANQTQTADSTGIATKSEWMRRSVSNYTGCVLNAIRDRNNDYLKVLFALAPKNTNQEAKPQTDNAETTNQNQNA